MNYYARPNVTGGVSKATTYLEKNGYSNASIYMECTMPKQVIKWLIEDQLALPESHRIRLKLQRSEESAAYCYLVEEVRAMIELCRNQSKLAWLANLIIALATTGMHISEAIGLGWSDIDFVSSMITLPDHHHSARHKNADAMRTTKGRCGRTVPIHSSLGKVLEAMPRSADGRVSSVRKTAGSKRM